MRSVGTVGALVLSALLVMAVAGTAQQPELAIPVSAAEAPRPVRYAHFEIRGALPETVPPVYLLEPDVDTFYDVVERMERAIKDKSIAGLVVKVGAMGAGWAKVQELREEFFRCRRAGKSVICYLEGGGNLTYYLASAADRVVLVPSGSLMLVGLRAEVLFFKGLLDMIGVKGDLLQMGDYKGAAEPFTNEAASESFREAVDLLLDDFDRQLTEGIARGRGIKPAAVRELIDSGPFTARRALAEGLVDDLMYYDELVDELREEAEGFAIVENYGKRKEAKPFFAGTEGLLKMLMGIGGRGGVRPEVPPRKAVAIVYAVGPIIMGGPDELAIGEHVISVHAITEAIREAKGRDNVKAIVLRVESPGGSAVASDLIWRELRQADEVKPVVVSLSDVAGSGGYYIAAGGRLIVAEPGTVTGSIGVVGGKFVLKELFGKLKITVEVFQRGKHAGILSSSEDLSESERARLRELMQETYDTFLERVAQTRNMPVERVREVAGGRPWSGFQAERMRLVDVLGGLGDAIAAAKEAAGIPPDEEVEIVRLPRSRSLLELLFQQNLDSSAVSPIGRSFLSGDIKRASSYLMMLRCLETEPTGFLMPALITIQ